MQLKKVHSSTPKISELIMQSLLEAMEDGTIQVKDELPPERDLAEKLGVGRSSLRECLAILEYLNIIETKGNRKVVTKDSAYFRKAVSFVRLSSSEMVVDSLEFRQAVEAAIVELACERATPEDMDRMNECILRMEQDIFDYVTDAEFHNCLARASHNAMFASTMDLLTTMIADLRLRYYRLPDYHRRTLESHRRIYEAIKARDKETAKKEVEGHIQLVYDFIEEDEANPELNAQNIQRLAD